jgi:site-specific recombinase XerD
VSFQHIRSMCPGTSVYSSCANTYQRMVARAGEAARFTFLIHSHMLRHSCGYQLANDGQDTRAIQHYLGHRSIASTVRYTALAPDRFKGFWKDETRRQISLKMKLRG